MSGGLAGVFQNAGGGASVFAVDDLADQGDDTVRSLRPHQRPRPSRIGQTRGTVRGQKLGQRIGQFGGRPDRAQGARCTKPAKFVPYAPGLGPRISARAKRRGFHRVAQAARRRKGCRPER